MRSFPNRITAFRRKLLAWFRIVGRDLPWRQTHDPYAIVVSEIMLQQTQVDRVIPKYQAWLQTFPTWEILAKASTTDVLKAWSGLGYNRRALMLQRLAQTIVVRGSFPQEIDDMIKLPGIGPYTAHAVAAFAFQKKGAAPVDTNIDRVLRRVFGRRDARKKEIAELAQTVAPKDVWSWNHALMDLGATKCMARNPKCETCPLKDICLSYPCIGDDIVKVKQKKFEGSDRMYRGKIVKMLQGREFLPVRQLGRLLDLTDKERMKRILDGLVKDGFIIVDAQGSLRIADKNR